MTVVNSRVRRRSKLVGELGTLAGCVGVMTMSMSLLVTGDALRGNVPAEAFAPPCVCSQDVGGVKTTMATLTTPTSRSTRLLPGVVYLMLFILKKTNKKR